MKYYFINSELHNGYDWLWFGEKVRQEILEKNEKFAQELLRGANLSRTLAMFSLVWNKKIVFNSPFSPSQTRNHPDIIDILTQFHELDFKESDQEEVMTKDLPPSFPAFSKLVHVLSKSNVLFETNQLVEEMIYLITDGYLKEPWLTMYPQWTKERVIKYLDEPL